MRSTFGSSNAPTRSRRSTSGGKWSKLLTPTTRGPAPTANSISVTAGTREMTRAGGVAPSCPRPYNGSGCAIIASAEMAAMGSRPRRSVRRRSITIVTSLYRFLASDDPVLCKRVGCGEDHRANEKADDAKPDQAADDAGDDQHQRQLYASPNQDRPQDVVEHPHRQAPNQEHGCPAGAACPVKPADRWCQHEQRTELRDAKDERDGGQQAGMRHAAEPEADAREYRLDQRCHDRTYRHGTDRLPGKTDGPFPGLATETLCKRHGAPRSGLALSVQNREQHDGEQDEHHGAANAAGCRDRPGRSGARIRLDECRE